jgi:hypothetical protein
MLWEIIYPSQQIHILKEVDLHKHVEPHYCSELPSYTTVVYWWH